MFIASGRRFFRGMFGALLGGLVTAAGIVLALTGVGLPVGLAVAGVGAALVSASSYLVTSSLSLGKRSVTKDVIIHPDAKSVHQPRENVIFSPDAKLAHQDREHDRPVTCMWSQSKRWADAVIAAQYVNTPEVSTPRRAHH